MADMPSESAVKNTATTFKISVLRCRKTGRVLYVEAGKDFVDTLFSFLMLPVGTILYMLSNSGGHAQVKAFGEISSIYESVEKLDCPFLYVDKKDLMQPKPAVAASACGSTGLLKGLEAAKIQLKAPIKLPATYYRCNSCALMSTKMEVRREVFDRSRYPFRLPQQVRPKDLEELEAEIKEAVQNPGEEVRCSTGKQGFVRKNITYMVTDCLEIVPSTTTRSIELLHKLKVTTLADLESNDTSVDITQILQLLQAALTSNTCLNDVFGMLKR